MTTWLPAVLVWLVACVAPSAAWLRFIWRVPPERDPASAVWGTFALGMAAGGGAMAATEFAAHVTGLHSELSTFASIPAILFVMVFAAPLAEGAKVAAAWPAFRSSHFDEEFDGILYATAAATGFAAGQSLGLLLQGPIRFDSVLRVLIVLVAHPLISPMWGHALGRVRRSRTPSGRFLVAWTVAAVVYGALLHLTVARSLLALIASFPVLLGLAFVTWWAARDLLARFGRTARISARSVLPSLPSPSISAMRHALRRSQSPILLHWIPIGALTTTGVMLTMTAVAIWAGHTIGLDFSAIEREDTSAIAIVPLVLLTAAVLAAFPVSGYLVTKASGADGVLEPALSAALAIVAVLVMLGLAAPVALVFALAFTPIAFALACAGAWFGLGR